MLCTTVTTRSRARPSEKASAITAEVGGNKPLAAMIVKSTSYMTSVRAPRTSNSRLGALLMFIPPSAARNADPIIHTGMYQNPLPPPI